MRFMFQGTLVATALAVTMLTAASAEAGTIYISGTDPDGRSVTAQVDYTFGAGYLDIDLRNTTSNSVTTSACETLTGLDFTVAGIGTSGWGLSTAAGDLITFGSSAPHTISSYSADQDLTVGSQWGVSANGSVVRLDWNNGGGPDYGIIGTDSNGDHTGGYANANSSLLNGHQPFVWEVGHFRLTHSSLTANSSFDTNSIQTLWGTSPGTLTVAVPLPSAAFAGLSFIAGLGAVHLLRRRRRSSL